MPSLIEGIVLEQIASLTASAAVFDQQRAQHLAAAESAAVEKGGALARVAELRAALDAYRELFPPEPEPEPDPEPDPEPEPEPDPDPEPTDPEPNTED